MTDFKHAALFRVLVASYETLRKHTADLAGVCDVLVCDEGHRLKAAGGGKTVASLLALNCPRRILLTGTPLQNNLDEFYGQPPHQLLYFVKQLIPRSTFKRVKEAKESHIFDWSCLCSPLCHPIDLSRPNMSLVAAPASLCLAHGVHSAADNGAAI